MSQTRPFTLNPVLTAIIMGYRNSAFIADGVLPRVPVAGEKFNWTQMHKEHFVSTPDNIGRAGRTNEVLFRGEEKTDSTTDHGLEHPIPQSDIDAAAAGGSNFDPLARATSGIAQKVGLNRELRTAGIVFNPNTYPVGNKTQLSGTDQWSDYDNSNPVADIFAALDSMLIRGNTLVVGRDVATILQQHPKVSQGLGGSATSGQVVAFDRIRDLFGLQQLLVGEAWVNNANPGQAESMDRTWTKHAALLHINPAPTSPDGSEITFGMTAQWQDRFAGDWEDRNIGMRGGRRVRAGESVREIITAPDVGFLIEDAIP